MEPPGRDAIRPPISEAWMGIHRQRQAACRAWTLGRVCRTAIANPAPRRRDGLSGHFSARGCQVMSATPDVSIAPGFIHLNFWDLYHEISAPMVARLPHTIPAVHV